MQHKTEFCLLIIKKNSPTLYTGWGMLLVYKMLAHSVQEDRHAFLLREGSHLFTNLQLMLLAPGYELLITYTIQPLWHGGFAFHVRARYYLHHFLALLSFFVTAPC
jgi:hypothetical protein